MRAFYEDRSGELVDLLLSRFDLHNLLALLRGQVREPAGGAGARERRTARRAGRGGGAARSRASRSSHGPSTCSSPGGCPIRPERRALADAWPEYERTEDLAALEHALTAAPRAVVSTRLCELRGSSADSLRELVAREHDAVNVLVVLRLRFALQLDELRRAAAGSAPGRFLAGGSIAEDALEEALRQPTRAEARREARRRRATRGLACAAPAHRRRRRPCRRCSASSR